MRKDLNKLLCERERTGGSFAKVIKKAKKRSQQGFKGGITAWPFEGESLSPFPTKVGMKKPYGWDTKNFNENLNPLWGFIRKSVGKSWDKVYSEICKNFDKRSVINQHILVHLFQNVEVNTFSEKGKVCYVNTAYGWRHKNRGITPIAESHCEYYVHPVSKILLANTGRKTYRQISAEREKKAQAERNNNLKLLSQFNNQNGTGSRYAIKIKDIWYEISVIKRPEPVKLRRVNAKGETEYYNHYPEVNDISIHGAKVTPRELNGTDFYVSRKTQLNSARL